MNIGGILIRREDLSAKDKKIVDELNRGWTGIKETHLQSIAGNAKPDGFPGIIVIASGASKVGIVFEIIKRGYVKELVIDKELADELTSSIESK
jgi:hypothetical protein